MPHTSKKILIVDDEPNIVLALKYLMEEAGFEVDCCYNGDTAIEMVTDLLPDLVILDVMMPGRDGYSVAKYIRSQSTLNKTSILFLTAKGTTQDKMEGYDSGAESYIVKPFDNDDIVIKVQEVLGVNM
ncbi:MAG: response regulator transcription factor [Saprospiraceae bacterium]|nr:response regulator transcription factor [Saprospiraceae bacterium]